MQITVCYMAQLKQAVGKSAERVETAAPCTLLDLVRLLADRHGEPLRRLLLAADGSPQPTNLFFVGEAQVQQLDQMLQDGAVVTVLSPIAGG